MHLKLNELYSEYLNTGMITGLKPFPYAVLEICKKMDDVNLDLRSDASCDLGNYYDCTLPIRSLTLVLLSYKESYLPVVNYLVQKGAKIEVGELSAICKKADKTISSLLPEIFNRFDKNTIQFPIDEEGNTILHVLALRTEMSDTILDFVLSQGINVNIINQNNKTAAHLAIENRNYHFLNQLLPLGLDLTTQYDNQSLKDILMQVIQTQGPIVDMTYQRLQQAASSDQSFDSKKFESAVAKFCEQHQLSSVEELVTTPSIRKTLLMSFFSQKDIIRYLTREKITFNTDSYPEYAPTEKALYDSCSNQIAFNNSKTRRFREGPKPFLRIPYRSEPEEYQGQLVTPHANFYSKGTMRQTTQLQLNLLKKQIASLDNSYIQFIFPNDIYKLGLQVGNEVNNQELLTNEQGFHYMISATRRDEHIFASLSIINTIEKVVHCHIIINSWKNPKYIEQAYPRINDYCNDPSAVRLGIKQIPSIVLDGSLQIQANEEDRNCGLYTIKICQALFQAINQNLELQHKLQNTPDKLSAHWEAEILPHLTLCLMKELPEFFKKHEEGGYEVRDYEELKAYHLSQRWMAGNKYLLNKSEKYSDRLIKEHEEFESIKKAL